MPVEVDLALTGDDARKLAGVHAKAKDIKKIGDKRNLHLEKEGTVAEGTVAWQAMSEHDRWGGGAERRGGGLGGGGG